MNFYTEMRGGVGDILIYMMRPDSDLGYFRSLKARGHTTMVQVVANHNFAVELFHDIPYVDHLRFVGGDVRIDTAPGERFFRINHSHERDLLWHQPTLALLDNELDALDVVTSKPYVAMHMTASDAARSIPNPEKLLAAVCRDSPRPIYLLGGHGERTDFKHPALTNLLGVPSLRLHIAIAQRAAKFIGPLSCFNCAAQLAKVPSFVLVNRSKTDPAVYPMMRANGAKIAPWNGANLDALYAETARWAAS